MMNAMDEWTQADEDAYQRRVNPPMTRDEWFGTILVGVIVLAFLLVVGAAILGNLGPSGTPSQVCDWTENVRLCR